MMKHCLLIAGFLLARVAGAAAESWPSALSRMPLGAGAVRLNRTNCAQLVLGGFQSNATVKALIFMPGATDELYLLPPGAGRRDQREALALDAVVALTNQSPLRVTFQPPFLLIYSEEDVLELDVTIQHPRTVEKLKTGKPMPQLAVIDRDWNQLLRPDQEAHRRHPDRRIEGTSGLLAFLPAHFRRLESHSVGNAGSVRARGQNEIHRASRNGVVFEVDHRVGAMPHAGSFPRAMTGD